MKAFVYEKGQLSLKEMELKPLEAEEVLVSLKVAGLNRRDIAMPNRLSSDQEAIILGSDGAGVIEAVVNDVHHVNVGDEVIINPVLGLEKNSDAPPEGFEILDVPDHRTIAEKIIISSTQVEKKTSYLSWEEAGVLAL